MAANYFYHWVFTSTFIYSLLLSGTLAFVLTLFISKKWEFQSITTDFEAQAFLRHYHDLPVDHHSDGFCDHALNKTQASHDHHLFVSCTWPSAPSLTTLPQAWGPIRGSRTPLLSPFARLSFFWPADAYVQGVHIPFNYILQISLYALLFTSALLAMSIGMFQTKDVG